MFNQKKEKILFAVLSLLMLLLYGMGLFTNVTGDAAKYACIAKNIATSNEWLVLKINGIPYWQKPPFLFWMSAISFQLFGISNVSFKIPILLYSLLGVWGTFQLGKKVFDKKTGFLAATMLAFSVIMVLYNSDIHTDIVLQTNVILGTWLLFEFIQTRKLIFITGSAIALGLAVLTKGPFGLLVPFFAVTGYIVSQKKYRLIIHPAWLVFFVVLILTMLPALIPIIKYQGAEGLWFFIWENNVGRATGTYMGTNTDPFFYLHSLAYLLLPWSVVIGGGIYLQFKRFIKKEFKAEEHYLFWGTWIVFLLMSLAKSKLPNYIQVVVPLLFIAAARAWVLYFVSGSGKWIATHRFTAYGLWTLIVLVPLGFQNGILYSLILLALFIASAFFTRKMSTNFTAFFSTLVLSIGIAFLLNVFLLPILYNIQAEKVAAAIIEREINAGEKVYSYKLKNLERWQKSLENRSTQKSTSLDKTPNQGHFFLNYELMFYCSREVEHIEYKEQTESILSQSANWFYTDQKGKDDLLSKSPNIKAIYTLKHFNIRSPAQSVNLKKRQLKLENKYLIHTTPLP